MADSKVQQEPSIEEILSSIRQIINEEDEAPAHVAADAAPPKPSHLADNDDDVLDLASIVKPGMEKTPAPAAPAPVAKAAPSHPDFDAEEGPDLDMEDHVEPTPAAPAPVTAAVNRAAPPIDTGLISDAAANAAIASLAKLAQAEVMIDHKHAAGIGSVTLEDVVKDMLRPMVKSWIDENLPPLVEKLVAREIEKLGKRV